MADASTRDGTEGARRSIIVLELQADDGIVEAIETTDNHPFYVVDRGWTNSRLATKPGPPTALH